MANPLLYLARLAGFEPATYGFVGKTSELHTLLNPRRREVFCLIVIFQKIENFADFL